MRATDFMHEDYLKIKETEDTSDTDMSASVSTILHLLKHKAQEINSSPEMSMQSFIQLVQNTGFKNFGYDDLVAANDSDLVKNLVKSFNKDTLILNLDDSEEIDNDDDEYTQDPETTVSNMANRAADI